MRNIILLAIFASALWVQAQSSSFKRTVFPPKPEGGIRVVVFGDSITGHRPAQPHQKQYLKYSDILGVMLEARIGLGKVQMINSGWAGDKTFPSGGRPGALGRVDVDLVAYKPDIAILLIGGNDNADTPEKQARSQENLRKIFQAAKASGARVLALQYHDGFPDPERPDKFWTHLSKRSEPLIASAAKEAGVALHDLAPDFAAAGEHTPHDHLVGWPDGVHLKPAGEVVIAKSIFRKLEQLEWIPE